MNIPSSQIQSRRRCGRAGARPVWHATCIGGYNLIYAENRGGSFEILGAGSHRAVAKHLACRVAPDIEFDGLMKSESYRVEDFQDFLPTAEAETSYLRRLQGYGS